MPEQPTCETCRYFHRTPEQKTKGIGYCYRFPPTLIDPHDPVSWHPVTQANWYCGEHTPRETRGSDAD